MMIDFAGRLKRLRIEKGYSQATLAKKITDAGQKLGEASIAKYESGGFHLFAAHIGYIESTARRFDCFACFQLVGRKLLLLL